MRVIVELLLQGSRLVKGSQFKRHQYIGDPENAIKLYNELKADELVICEINSTDVADNRRLLCNLNKQAFMPICYAGNIKSFSDVDNIFSIGFDKIRFTSAVYFDKELISYAIENYGRQAVVLGIDLISHRWRSGLWARVTDGDKVKLVPYKELLSFAVAVNPCEFLIRSVDFEGTMAGVDARVSSICRELSSERSVIYSGGVSGFDDILKLRHDKVVGVAVGAMTVFHGRKRGVLISYPKDLEMEKLRSGWKKRISDM